MSEQLDARIRKRLAGVCMDCTEKVADDSDYCAKHDAMARARASKAQRKERKRRAKLGLCRDGCGRKVARRRKSDGSLMLTRCSACKKRHAGKQSERRAKQRGINGSVCGVIGTDEAYDPRWRPDYDPITGAAWNRYRGKGRRGRLTREEQLDEIIRDLGFARDKIVDAMRSVAVLKLPEVVELPVIQREAAKREAFDPIEQAARILDGLLGK